MGQSPSYCVLWRLFLPLRDFFTAFVKLVLFPQMKQMVSACQDGPIGTWRGLFNYIFSHLQVSPRRGGLRLWSGERGQCSLPHVPSGMQAKVLVLSLKRKVTFLCGFRPLSRFGPLLLSPALFPPFSDQLRLFSWPSCWLVKLTFLLYSPDSLSGCVSEGPHHLGSASLHALQ